MAICSRLHFPANLAARCGHVTKFQPMGCDWELLNDKLLALNFLTSYFPHYETVFEIVKYYLMNDFMDQLCQLGVLTIGLIRDRNKPLFYLAILFGDLCCSNFP